MKIFNQVKKLGVFTGEDSIMICLGFASPEIGEDPYRFEFPLKFSSNVSRAEEINSKIDELSFYLAHNPIKKIENEMRRWHRVKNVYTIYIGR